LDYVCPFEIFDNGSTYSRVKHSWDGKIHIPLRWETKMSFNNFQNGIIE
jgi:hypothetical protein